MEYLDRTDAAAALARQADALGATELARVRNLEYAFAPAEFYPLAPHAPLPLTRIAAFAVDMDGTSTTTEPLALHSLEYMVRRFTGCLDPSAWPGLDEQHDLPFVIGNSNFRHTEFLVSRYRDRLDLTGLRQAFFEALVWTLANLDDAQRRREITRNAAHCGLSGLLSDPDFRQATTAGPISDAETVRRAGEFVSRHGAAFECRHTGELVSAALDIYYMRYHSILQRIERGEGASLSRELLTDASRRLIEPMPGYTVFVCLLKGWLGTEAAALVDQLQRPAHDRPANPARPPCSQDARPRLARLGAYFQHHPAELALVTASIAYEAYSVMNEVRRIMAGEVQDWPLAPQTKDHIVAQLHSHDAVFDAFVNASEAHEARLKPHRDLYSIALYQMSIPPTDYACCIGLEDTEPGIVSLRAAGIGTAVALPNRDTHRQNYAAATRVVRGGLPELILSHNMLVDESCLIQPG